MTDIRKYVEGKTQEELIEIHRNSVVGGDVYRAVTFEIQRIQQDTNNIMIEVAFLLGFLAHNLEEFLWLPEWSQSAGIFHPPVTRGRFSSAVFPHLLATICQRRYAPGLATVLITLPLAALFLGRAVEANMSLSILAAATFGVVGVTVLVLKRMLA